MPPTSTSEVRYEKKLRVSNVELAPLEHMLREHRAHFVQAYPDREVNNVYFDTPTHAYLQEHVDGISTRKKIRVRWYGGNHTVLQRPRLEIKRRDGHVISKDVMAVDDVELKDVLRSGGLAALCAGRENLAELATQLEPTLLNRYRRKYYQSSDGRVRATIDFDMTFGSPLGLSPNIKDHRDSVIVLEFKYSNAAAREGEAATASFPFHLSKNSKYVNGMHLVLGRTM